MGCNNEERPPPFVPDAGGDAPQISDAGQDCEGPPPSDAAALCGNEIIPITSERQNIYFVIDSSGSMSEALPGSERSKLEGAQSAITSVLLQIGHRVHYGAAHFPEGTDLCDTGAEFLETQPGDPRECGLSDGDTLRSFTTQMRNLRALGGTPVASTLEVLEPTLTNLPGKTAVILVTDGSPNCNPNARCDVDECMLNIEGFSYMDQACDDGFNCCDPELTEPGAQLNCVDVDASERAVELLADHGIDTFVIGMPGSELFASVLDRLAVAGGTAREESPRYFEVSDVSSLTETLENIGTAVAIPCEVTLSDSPPDADLVNVYFDTELVEASAEDGWAWADEATITFHGGACATLQSGSVFNVQVVAGCPTVIR